MTFYELQKFIQKDMSMQHIYQPVMLIELLKNQGQASVTQIAQAILNKDPSQIEYYAQIVKRMVGDVLTNKRKITTKDKDQYFLEGAKSLSKDQVAELVGLCESKIAEYEAKRQGAQWEHRRRGRRPVSGTIRYEVLKRAKGRCELCGISNEEKNLEVDHITPKSLGGKDDIANYQALCFTCNAQKNNKDDTDFRNINAQYEHREKDCLFCQIQTDDRKRVVDENTLAYAIRDGFEVTKHHTLFIPKRHIKDCFGLSQAEINAINQLIESQKEFLDDADSSIDGYNIGMNCGEAAGQTIFHCHVHLIPRRKGDVDNPRGGIRHVIPEKGFYKS
jgi:diadenosine tetraphosphate (Ap4A) HIT family hydrolase/5-methylcytosine-specific restriction endonuclease McrA